VRARVALGQKVLLAIDGAGDLMHRPTDEIGRDRRRAADGIFVGVAM